MFCPNAVVFGDLATWLSAVATIAAVLVALRTSNASLRAMKDLQREELERAEKARHDNAVAMSLGLHHEIYMAIGQMRFAAVQLQDPVVRSNAEYTLIEIRTVMPDEGMHLLPQLVDKLEAFEPTPRRMLMRCLSTWNAVTKAPPVDAMKDADEIDIQTNADLIARSLDAAVADFEAALDSILPLVREVWPEAPGK